MIKSVFEMEWQVLIIFQFTRCRNLQNGSIGQRKSWHQRYYTSGYCTRESESKTDVLPQRCGRRHINLNLNNPNLNRLRNYHKYYSLSDEETDTLLALVLLFSPDELLNKVFFHSEDCGRFTNQFFELSAVSNMVAVADNIVIGGERKKVAKIMFFTRSWMENNYITPIRSFQGRLERMARGLPGRAPSPPASSWPCNIL